MTENAFGNLRALFINCSIKKDKKGSHTQFLIDKVAGIMAHEGVAVDQLYLLDHHVAFGMIKDGKEEGLKDEWPSIQKRILDADILVIGTPIWLGDKSSVASLVIERMYAYSGDRNEKKQYIYYGKTAGCIITGNEDGYKHCARDILYAMQHIGYMIPPQADCGWVGEAGPGPSYGDKIEGSDLPVGFGNDFTNRNATFLAWNLMHTAHILKQAGGLPAIGNTTDDWEQVANAKHQNPEYH
ncbi:MAG TPA: NAD(P)H-dependent oxidoreductase [Candidatus Saccharimonadales bacterium]|nr:NAD(P)H-dependent oxidoreductase [Candidatus Saccharimonadales bacterium]